MKEISRLKIDRLYFPAFENGEIISQAVPRGLEIRSGQIIPWKCQGKGGKALVVGFTVIGRACWADLKIVK